MIAVDENFVLFSRAWCVAEIAAAHKVGMKQSIKIASTDALDRNEGDLRNLRIENMEATRPEDRDEILRKIEDHDAFDARVQTLLFNDLLPAWRRLDVASQLDRVGHFVRWQAVANRRGSKGVLNPRGQEAPEILEPHVVGASYGLTLTTVMDLDELVH